MFKYARCDSLTPNVSVVAAGDDRGGSRGVGETNDGGQAERGQQAQHRRRHEDL